MSNHSPDLHTVHYHEIKVGMKVSRDYVITPEIYEHFLAAFHDYSPVHVDDEFARSRGFPERVMHGSLLNGFISHFVGMNFPGRFSLLLSVDLRFLNPSYLGDAIHLEAVVSQKMDARHVVVLDVVLSNTTRNHLAARGRIQVMVKEAP
jgi:acyl dehydratase